MAWDARASLIPNYLRLARNGRAHGIPPEKSAGWGSRVCEVPVDYLSEPSTLEFVREGLNAIRDLIGIRRNPSPGFHDS